MTVYRSERPPEPSTTQVVRLDRRRRRGSVVLRLLGVLVVLVVLANVLFVEAYANARFAPDGAHRSAAATGVPAAVREGGPVIDARGDRPRSAQLPARTVALTFDDGPDPRWTPRILDVLARHDARATSSWSGPRPRGTPT